MKPVSAGSHTCVSLLGALWGYTTLNDWAKISTMKISVLTDSNWEAKLDHAIRPLTLREFFEGRSYGNGLLGICIIVCARDSLLNHQRRERLTKSDRTLHFDVMLSLNELVKASHQHRRDLVCGGICSELERTLERKNFADFDRTTFLADFSRAIHQNLQGEAASRFDQFCLERAFGY